MDSRRMVPRIAACAGRAAALAGLLLATPVVAGDATVATVRLTVEEWAVALEVPGHCLIREGPGTAEAVCDPDGSPEASRRIAATSSLYLEVTVQPFAAPGGGPQPPEALAQRYTFADFQKDLPGAVCGEERISRIRIESPQRQVADGRVTYAATITCPEVKFLGLEPRRALVRYILTDGLRVNVMARALAEDFDRSRSIVDAFLASVQLQGERKP